jgi:demethylmenaquinone methyltransferase / 2-methoxy-6-polyprenyl-1,4-benzoquinol methylase
MNTASENKHTFRPLHGIFTEIPPRYDLINRLITLGMDSLWRRKAAGECLKSRPQHFLDLCCGTGDLTILIAKMADYPISIIGLDYSRPMLKLAERKAREKTGRKIKFTPGDASKLPFKNEEMDSVGISFAFRNLTYNNPLSEKHVMEIVRILKPGGRFVIAESSQPANRFIRACYHFYMRNYVYRVGALLSGNRPAYKYLVESSCDYFSPDAMKKFLKEKGFKEILYKPLFFGAAGIYTAVK